MGAQVRIATLGGWLLTRHRGACARHQRQDTNVQPSHNDGYHGSPITCDALSWSSCPGGSAVVEWLATRFAPDEPSMAAAQGGCQLLSGTHRVS